MSWWKTDFTYHSLFHPTHHCSSQYCRNDLKTYCWNWIVAFYSSGSRGTDARDAPFRLIFFIFMQFPAKIMPNHRLAPSLPLPLVYNVVLHFKFCLLWKLRKDTKLTEILVRNDINQMETWNPHRSTRLFKIYFYRNGGWHGP